MVVVADREEEEDAAGSRSTLDDVGLLGQFMPFFGSRADSPAGAGG